MGTIWRTWNEISLIKRILVFLVIGVIVLAVTLLGKFTK